MLPLDKVLWLHSAKDGVALEIDASRALPYQFQLHINRLRGFARLEPIDFASPLPNRRSRPTDHAVGDVCCHGVVIVQIPGVHFDGPLSLTTLLHQLAFAASGSAPQSLLFNVVAAFLFHDVVDWVCEYGHSYPYRILDLVRPSSP